MMQTTPENIGSSGMKQAEMNQLMLEKIFSKCPIDSLNSCRLVNKLWHKCSLPFWSSFVPPLVLVGERNNNRQEESSGIIFQDYFHALNDPSRHYENTGKRLSREVKLEQFEVSSRSSQLFSWFQSEEAQWIRKLTLNKVLLQDLESFRCIMLSKYTSQLETLEADIRYSFKVTNVDEVFEDIGMNPNLKSLQITWDMSKRNRQELPISWKELLSCYPNLNSLTLIKSKTWHVELEQVLQGVIQIRQENANPQISSLDFMSTGDTFNKADIPVSLGLCFVDATLPLTFLALDLGISTTGVILYNILNCHRDTLKQLYLCRHPSSPLLLEPTCIPRMKSLLQLTVTGRITFESLSFLKSLPELETLKFADCKRNSDFFEEIVHATSDLDIGVSVVHKLDEFICDYDHNCNSEQIQKLVELMPLVTKLHMKLTNETFRVVCRDWRQLMNITIYGDAVDDEGITGIVFGGGEVERSHPNILNLQDLTSFRMNNDSRRGHRGNALISKLTSKSIFLGFLQMPKLNTLEVNFREMSDTAAEKLGEKIPYLNVSLGDGEWIDLEDSEEDFEDDLSESANEDDDESLDENLEEVERMLQSWDFDFDSIFHSSQPMPVTVTTKGVACSVIDLTETSKPPREMVDKAVQTETMTLASCCEKCVVI